MTLQLLRETHLALLAREHLETLLNLSHAFNSTVELDTLLPRILELTLEATEAEAGTVWLLEGDRVRCAATAGPAAVRLRGACVATGQHAVGEAIRAGRTLIVPDALEDERFRVYCEPLRGFRTRSALVIPLLVNGTGVGAIELVNDFGGKDHFTEQDIAFLEALADDAAAAVRNAGLFEAERRAHHFQAELNRFGQLFVIVIVMMAVGITLGTVVAPGVSPVVLMGYSWAAMLIFLIPILLFSRRNGIPLSEFGVTTRGWKRHALEGVLVAIPLIAVMPFAKRMMYADVEALVTFARYMNYPRSLVVFDILLYLPHAYLQELAARGLIQGSLQRFMADSHPLVPILATSALFGVGHLYAGFAFAFLTLAMSFILGVLYMRQGSLVGVTITHTLCGVAALAFGLF